MESVQLRGMTLAAARDDPKRPPPADATRDVPISELPAHIASLHRWAQINILDSIPNGKPIRKKCSKRSRVIGSQGACEKIRYYRCALVRVSGACFPILPARPSLNVADRNSYQPASVAKPAPLLAASRPIRYDRRGLRVFACSGNRTSGGRSSTRACTVSQIRAQLCPSAPSMYSSRNSCAASRQQSGASRA